MAGDCPGKDTVGTEAFVFVPGRGNQCPFRRPSTGSCGVFRLERSCERLRKQRWCQMGSGLVKISSSGGLCFTRVSSE